MKKRYALCVFLSVLAVGFFLAISPGVSQDKKTSSKVAPAATVKDAPAQEKDIWNLRCDDPKDGADKNVMRGRCEIFQRLSVEETGQRLVELAIGYPNESNVARGVIILPLGVLLNQGTQMSINGGEPFTFQVRYCNQEGCFAYINLNETVMDMLKKGTDVSLAFSGFDGRKFRVDMSLKGLSKKLRQIQ